MDNRGIGKPQSFDNIEDHFRKWSRSVSNYVTSILGKSFETLLEWCVEQEEEVSAEAAALEYEGEGKYEELDDQLLRCLQSLTDKESEDIVNGCKTGLRLGEGCTGGGIFSPPAENATY